MVGHRRSRNIVCHFSGEWDNFRILLRTTSKDANRISRAARRPVAEQLFGLQRNRRRRTAVFEQLLPSLATDEDHLWTAHACWRSHSVSPLRCLPSWRLQPSSRGFFGYSGIGKRTPTAIRRRSSHGLQGQNRGPASASCRERSGGTPRYRKANPRQCRPPDGLVARQAKRMPCPARAQPVSIFERRSALRSGRDVHCPPPPCRRSSPEGTNSWP
jgi:hypothetical protein